MKSKIILIVLFSMFILMLTSVKADVIEKNSVFYGTIADNGSLITSSTPVTNFSVIGFVCSNNECSSVNGSLWNGQILNSGSSSKINLDYPTILEQSGYGIYIFKEGYIPYEVKANFAGSGNANDASDYLTKKLDCTIPINDLTFSSNNTNFTISLNIPSPISLSGLLGYIPSSLSSFYSVNSIVNFTFIGPENLSLTQNVNLPYSKSKPVSSSVILKPGQYSFSVQVASNDSQCVNSITTSTLNFSISIQGTSSKSNKFF